MEEEQNLEAMSDLKIHKNHLLVLDPNSVLAWGVLRSSGLVCSRAFIMDGTRLHHNQEERHIYTDVQPHQCNVLMWADCLNDARSGVVLGITDMAGKQLGAPVIALCWQCHHTKSAQILKRHKTASSMCLSVQWLT